MQSIEISVDKVEFHSTLASSIRVSFFIRLPVDLRKVNSDFHEAYHATNQVRIVSLESSCSARETRNPEIAGVAHSSRSSSALPCIAFGRLLERYRKIATLPIMYWY